MLTHWRREVVIVNRTAVLSIVLLVSALGAQPAFSQGASPEIPDLNGVWAWGRCVDGSGFGCMLLEEDDPRLTARARGFQAAFDEIAAPKYDCAPMTIPHMYTDPYSYQIEQLTDRVVITYGKDDVVRTIWLEGYDHPEPAGNEFFVQGFATGHYEGDALVVETGRFTFDPTGLNSDFKLPSSTQKRVAERYSRDGDALLLEVSTEDTFFLREPWSFTVRSQPAGEPLALPWNCDLEAARQTLRLVPTVYPEDPPVVRDQ
jgi:hypothetical protein